MNQRIFRTLAVSAVAVGLCVARVVADDDASATAEPSNTPAVSVQPTTPPLHTFEYAEMKLSSLPDPEIEAQFNANKVSLDEIGRNGPESGRRKLLRDLGGKGTAPDALALLNELGSQGWELISHDDEGQSNLYTFKRQMK